VSRPTKIPSYRRHKQSGQAVVTLTGGGGRRDVLLGPYGSPESHREYARVIAEWVGTASGQLLGATSDLTVNELLLAFWKHAATYYRRGEGQPTSELHNYRAVIRTLRVLYGHTSACDFGPKSLKAVRQQWVTAGIVRSQVNARVYRVRRIFRWAAAEGLLSSAIAAPLKDVDGLRAGRCDARESIPVAPVTDERVAAVLPHLPPVIRDMVAVQRLTGMRPGELCVMNWAQIERTGPVWFYRPAQHKCAHRGKQRVVPLGPRAQQILHRYFTGEPENFVFSPRVGELARQQLRSANRKTPRYPSHLRRNAAKRKAKPRWVASDQYTEAAYRRAIARAGWRWMSTGGTWT
jgi:integrase